MKRTMSEVAIISLMKWKTRHMQRQNADPDENVPTPVKKVNSVNDLLIATKIFQGQ